jgi:hypothetical protein
MRAHLWQVHKDSTATQCAEETVGTKRPL